MPFTRRKLFKMPKIAGCYRLFLAYLFVLVWPAITLAQPGKRIDSLKNTIKRFPENNKLQKGLTLLKLGDQYNNISDYPAAMDCYQQSLVIAQRISNDTLTANAYRHMSHVAFSQGDVAKDSIYVFTALRIYKKAGDKLNEAMCLKEIGASYLNNKKLPQAKLYLEQALAIFKQLNQQQQIAGVYSDMSLEYWGDYRKVIELSLLAKKIWDKYPPDNALALINVGNIGTAYFYMVRYDSLKHVKHDTLITADSATNLKKAERYIKQAIDMAKRRNDVENRAYFTEIMSELQFHNGDYKDAYLNYEFYQDTNDSLFSQQNKNKIAELESKNELEKKNLEIEKQKQHVREQHRNIILLGLGLLAVIAIGMLYYRLSVVRKQKNVALTVLNEQLDSANRSKAKFFAILTHDLRSPIANLVNFLQLQKREPQLLSDEQKAEQEKKITGAALSLLTVMEEILMWSKGQMENFEQQKKQVPVTALFSYLQDFFAGVSHVKFTYDAATELEVYTDENFLKTIMHNLTQNAVNALTGVPNPSISWRGWKEGDVIKLSITDNGGGMTPEQVKKFHENDNISSAKRGLGLHLVKDLTQMISCKITLESGIDRGTVFTLSCEGDE